MTEDTNRKAQFFHELYLYPDLDKTQNVFRGLAWIASWIFGVFIPKNSNQQESLSGALLIFSISLLLEFLIHKRESRVRKIADGILNSALVLMLIFAILLSRINKVSSPNPYNIIEIICLALGWSAVAYIFVGMIIACAEVDSIASKAEPKPVVEKEQTIEEKRFMDNLIGKISEEDEEK